MSGANIICTPKVISLCLPSYYRGRPCLTPTTKIEIACDTPGTRLFYTVNGRIPEPLEGWQINDVTWPYDGPFSLSSHDDGYIAGFRTIRAVAIDTSMSKRSSIVTKIFYVLLTDDQKDIRAPRRKRNSRSSKQNAKVISTLPLLAAAGIKELSEMTVAIPENQPQGGAERSKSKWKRLTFLSSCQQEMVSRFRVLNQLNEDKIIVANDMVSEGLDSKRRSSFDVIPEAEEKTLDGSTVDANADVVGVPVGSEEDDEEDANYDYSANSLHRKQFVDSHPRILNGGDSDSVKESNELDENEIFPNFFVKAIVEDPSEVSFPEKDHHFQELECRLNENDEFVLTPDHFKKTVSLVSRATQAVLEFASCPRVSESVDCGTQCHMHLDSSGNATESAMENVEVPVGESTLHSTENSTKHKFASCQTEDVLIEVNLTPPIETISIGVGHDTLLVEEKSCQTLATELTLEHKAVQTELRWFSVVFDDDSRDPRRRSDAKVSPGRGYWRQQIDHITKELKTQANNSLEFRAMIAEPRMTGIKRVIVHEGLDEMVLVVNVGLRSHPEWCCKS